MSIPTSLSARTSSSSSGSAETSSAYVGLQQAEDESASTRNYSTAVPG
ncbi:hypothetical protein [Microbispora catharanthi]|nr:hypothetical protein [Microbispora catharanthi]